MDSRAAPKKGYFFLLHFAFGFLAGRDGWDGVSSPLRRFLERGSFSSFTSPWPSGATSFFSYFLAFLRHIIIWTNFRRKAYKTKGSHLNQNRPVPKLDAKVPRLQLQRACSAAPARRDDGIAPSSCIVGPPKSKLRVIYCLVKKPMSKMQHT